MGAEPEPWTSGRPPVPRPTTAPATPPPSSGNLGTRGGGVDGRDKDEMELLVKARKSILGRISSGDVSPDDTEHLAHAYYLLND